MDGNTPPLPPGHPFEVGATPIFWSETTYARGPNVLVGVFSTAVYGVSGVPEGSAFRTWCVRAPTGARQ